MTKLELAQQKLEHATAVLMCRQYRQIGESLRAFSAKNYPAGTVVQVARPSGYFLQGFSHFPEDACPNDQLPVTLENGNVWWYGLETITIPEKSTWEPWVKREHRKLALRRTKLLGGKAQKAVAVKSVAP